MMSRYLVEEYRKLADRAHQQAAVGQKPNKSSQALKARLSNAEYPR